MNIPFQTEHFGKCNNCQDNKPLDSMVREQYKKGTYECIDCFSEKIDVLKYDVYTTWKIDHRVVSRTRIKKLIAWCFG